MKPFQLTWSLFQVLTVLGWQVSYFCLRALLIFCRGAAKTRCCATMPRVVKKRFPIPPVRVRVELNWEHGDLLPPKAGPMGSPENAHAARKPKVSHLAKRAPKMPSLQSWKLTGRWKREREARCLKTTFHLGEPLSTFMIGGRARGATP